MLPAPESTRLVTIIAHVDHGKTTLADNLIESNGIISERLAGTLRYLDSDAEEQRRGITMRASAIGLRHVYNPPKMSSGSSSPQDMVVHMIDSPGHVDFAAEVTSSLLLCDSAILVVDAVEGICARTHSLLREAYRHQLVPVLVVNKVDRLCMDLGLDPSEAYVRIRELIESMNAVCASMLNSDVNDDTMEAVDGDANANNDNDIDEKKASLWNFDPIKGNIVFASGLHGWGFTIPTLARSLFKSKTIPMKPPLLRQYLFGDFKYNAETGKVLKWKQSGNSSGEPMFAEYALAPLWEIYEGVSQAAASVGLKTQNGNTGKKTENAKILASTSGMDRVLAAIQIGSTSPGVISPQPNNSNHDDRPIPQTTDDMQRLISRLGASSESSIVSAVLRRYRPLSVSVLDAVSTLELRPKVLALQDPPHQNDDFDNMQQAVHQCNPENDTVVAHVCKFASISRSAVTDPDLPSVSPDDQSSSIMMGIARVLSGTLCTGDEYYMFGPRYNRSSDDIPKQKIRCYLLMGSSFVRVNSIPAGHICAIYDLEKLQLKTVTLSDKKECMPLRGFDFGLQPLVKVNVEPVNASETETLERGLLKLSLADSSVEVTATAKGERILACLGEIHLERSILDLETVYCDGNIKIRTSDPITSFRETTAWFPNEEDFDSFRNSKIPPLRQTIIPPYCDEEGLEHAYKGRCRAVISGRGCAITIRIVPLPRSVYECLKSKKLIEGCEDDLMMLGKALKCSNNESTLTPQSALTALLGSLDDIDSNGNALLEAPVLYEGRSVKAVCSTNGEVYIPPKEEITKDGEDDSENVDGLEEYNAVQECLRTGMDKEVCDSDTNNALNDADAIALDKWRQDMRGSALAGFQLAMRAGPLCEEPVQGVAVILESVEIAMRDDGTKQFTPAKELSGGMVVAALRSGIRCALLSRPARIVEGHLKLTLHSSLAGLGSLHAVLSKRRGRVVTDSMVDGTDLIQVTATIPQAESFGLAPELLKKSSGEVTAPELVFSHWEVLEEDPFWVPTTEEEREDHGDLTTASDSDALKYIRIVRSRKGLLVDSSKIVVAAEKQRTLSRKK
ncbi:elongation factor 2 family protein [Skeletonema marinoi]|uniref:Elongation factor 2 family protein n=1 Tax=Skeletonema marinoi TaxID=267567 RepID=A0AAD9DBX9_9STRA|nr:elongation factor 2 family protein [Skeletonema marinoi]